MYIHFVLYGEEYLFFVLIIFIEFYCKKSLLKQDLYYFLKQFDMVVGTAEQMQGLADVVFVIEGTASNGAYINDIKTNYIIPTLE